MDKWEENRRKEELLYKLGKEFATIDFSYL